MALSVDVLNQINAHGNEVLRHNLQFLYEALSILDRKANALLAFDGLLVAAAAFGIEKGGIVSAHPWRRNGVILVLVLALAAAGLCLLVTRISYDFLNNASVTGGALNLGGELEGLIAVLKERTAVYMSAWNLSVIAVIVSVLLAATVFFIPIETERARLPRRRRRH